MALLVNPLFRWIIFVSPPQVMAAWFCAVWTPSKARVLPGKEQRRNGLLAFVADSSDCRAEASDNLDNLDARLAIESQRSPEHPIAMDTAPRPSVFISYSHQDEAWKDRLVK